MRIKDLERAMGEVTKDSDLSRRRTVHSELSCYYTVLVGYWFAYASDILYWSVLVIGNSFLTYPMTPQSSCITANNLDHMPGWQMCFVLQKPVSIALKLNSVLTRYGLMLFFREKMLNWLATRDNEQVKSLEESLKEAEKEVLSVSAERDKALQDLKDSLAYHERELSER
nr:protein GRIP isoform X1 [Ipomoea trifida]